MPAYRIIACVSVLRVLLLRSQGSELVQVEDELMVRAHFISFKIKVCVWTDSLASEKTGEFGSREGAPATQTFKEPGSSSQSVPKTLHVTR